MPSRLVRIAIAFVCAGVTSAAIASAAPMLPALQPRIIHGDPATGDFRFLVALLSSDALDGGLPFDSQFCGGTLTSPTTVVTAAHCVVEEGAHTASGPEELVVGFGRDLNAPMRLVRVSGVVANPAYLKSDSAADIAVLTLASPVTDVPPLAAVSPLEAAALTAAGIHVTTAGWGNTSASSDKYPNSLRQAEMVVFPVSNCGNGYNYTVSGLSFEGWGRADVDPKVMLCAAGVSRGMQVDTCEGDSGGPLIAGTGAAARLVGIVSWGADCDSGTSGVYTRVSATYEFLLAHGAIAPIAPPTGSPTVSAAALNNALLITFSAGSVSLPVTGTAASVINPATGQVVSCVAPVATLQCRVEGLSNGTKYNVTAVAGTLGGDSAVSSTITAMPAAVPDPGAVVRAVQVDSHEVYFRVSAAHANGPAVAHWKVVCVSPTGTSYAGAIENAGVGGDAWVEALPRGTYKCSASATTANGTGNSLSVPVRVKYVRSG